MIFSQILAQNLEKRSKREKMFIDDYLTKNDPVDERNIYHLTSASKVSSKSNRSFGNFGFNHDKSILKTENIITHNKAESRRSESKNKDRVHYLQTNCTSSANKESRVYLNTESSVNTDKFHLYSKETNAYSTKSKKLQSNNKNIKIHLNDLNLIPNNTLRSKSKTARKKDPPEIVNYSKSNNTAFNLPNLKTFYNQNSSKNNEFNNTLFPKINFPNKIENITNYDWRVNTQFKKVNHRERNKDRLPDFIKNNL